MLFVYPTQPPVGGIYVLGNVGAMSKQSLQPVRPQFDIRPGEGFPVELEILPSKTVAGQTQTSFRANIASIPVPAKRYSADVAYVMFNRGVVQLLFGQTSLLNEKELRTLIVIKMTPIWAYKFICSLSEGGDKSFNKVAELNHMPREALSAFAAEEPKETIAFNATIVLTAISGGEGALDFFHTSPFAMGQVPKTKKLPLEPVVRVILNGSTLLGLTDALTALISDLPPDIQRDFEELK